MSAQKLELYFYPQCPYCQMVIASIADLGIKLEYKNIIEDQAALKKLMDDTGRRTVPCLYIDNKPMFESRDIINWLQKNQANLDKT